MDGGPVATGTIIAIISLIFKAFITACEVAVVEVSDSRLKKQSDQQENYKKLKNLLEHPNKLITSLSIFRVMTAVIVTVVSTVTYYYPLSNQLSKVISVSGIRAVVVIAIIIVVLSILLHIFGVSIPRRLAQKDSLSFALKVTGLLRFIEIILTPVSKIDYYVTMIFGKMFGYSFENNNQAVTEEEILLMVDAVNETGVIEESQREMINNIFEFDDLLIYDVMTHRTNIVAVEKDSTVSELIDAAISEGFSRIPIYDESIDNIIGVVHVKDLLVLLNEDKNKNQKISKYIRSIKYIPETNHCGEVFKEFTSTKTQIAVVVDEYGGTAGLVTMEDLLEEIVGNIQDEYDDETEEIVKKDDITYEILGEADPEAVFKALDIDMPEQNDYETMGGFVIDILGHIPSQNESPVVEYNGVRFKVLSVVENRIVMLEAKLI